MTRAIQLSPEQEARLASQAARRGVDEDKLLAEIVGQALERAPDEAQGYTGQRKRIGNLHPGNVIFMSEDFDDPLPDEFWLGEE